MGRTIPTINAHLQKEEDSWRPTRAALRREDKALIDRIFTRMRKRSTEAGAAAKPIPFDMLLLAWMLDVEAALERLEKAGEAAKTSRSASEPCPVDPDAPNVFVRHSDNI